MNKKQQGQQDHDVYVSKLQLDFIKEFVVDPLREEFKQFRDDNSSFKVDVKNELKGLRTLVWGLLVSVLVVALAALFNMLALRSHALP